ncbi:ComF family protein [Jeotgalibaca porci]|uniref:ComF family protein n=2 Tax=Jeotgalibaca porci TaxID=1868793 RepID=UPI00359F148F
MPNCLMCNRALPPCLTLKQIFSFHPHESPIICEKCRQTFRWIEKETACPGCSRPQKASTICMDCEKWQARLPSEYVSHEAFFYYDAALKEWLQRYKFQGDTRFAQIMSATIQTFLKKSPDAVVVPIPVSEASYAKRGFNQCEELLRIASVPYENWLINISLEKKQSEKKRQERLKTAQPFQLAPTFNKDITSVILFDDVYTTGRTLMHAKHVFAEAGVKRITSFSIGR